MTSNNFLSVAFFSGFLLIAPLTATEETRCTEFWVSDYEYNQFYDLSRLKNARDQSDEYFAKLPITFESIRGDIHVAFAESTQIRNNNRVYEFHGVVQIVETDTQFKFNLTDHLPVIPVKYVSFAGYRGSRSKITFDCVNTSVVDTDHATTTETVIETTTEIVSTAGPTSLQASLGGLIDTAEIDFSANEVVSKDDEKE